MPYEDVEVDVAEPEVQAHGLHATVPGPALHERRPGPGRHIRIPGAVNNPVGGEDTQPRLPGHHDSADCPSLNERIHDKRVKHHPHPCLKKHLETDVLDRLRIHKGIGWHVGAARLDVSRTALHLHQPVDHFLRNAADDLLPAKRVEGHDRQPQGGVAPNERLLLQHRDGGACSRRRDGCADPRRASPGNQDLAMSERTHGFLPLVNLLINCHVKIIRL